MDDMKCEAGCKVFYGGERKHHRNCVHYPESLTKLWHDTEAGYLAEIERLRYVLEGVRAAIKTGRNEPLQIWRDQIDIALSEDPHPNKR